MTYNDLALSLTRYIDSIATVVQINDRYILSIDEYDEIGVEQFVSAQVDCVEATQCRKDRVACDIIDCIKKANHVLSLGSTKKLITEKILFHKTESRLH